MDNELKKFDNYVEEVKVFLDGLTYPEVLDWLRLHIHGSDSILPYSPGTGPADPVANIYPLLGRHVKEDLIRAINTLAHEFFNAENPDEKYAEELLLLLQDLKPDDINLSLREFVTSPDFNDKSENVRYRIGQTLITFGLPITSEFWKNLFESNKTAFAGLAFDGLALISPETAINFLPDLPDDPAVAKLINNALPSFFKGLNEAEVQRLCSLIFTRIQEYGESVRGVIEKYFERVGFSCEPKEGIALRDQSISLRIEKNVIKKVTYTFNEPQTDSYFEPLAACL